MLEIRLGNLCPKIVLEFCVIISIYNFVCEFCVRIFKPKPVLFLGLGKSKYALYLVNNRTRKGDFDMYEIRAPCKKSLFMITEMSRRFE